MFVEEINAKGGVLGRKIELVVRDTKGNADEAVRVARDLILRENVDFLFGTLTSAEGPAVSPIAKENKIVFVVPVVKTDQLDREGKPAPVYLPHRQQHHDRGPHRGRDHGEVAERQARRHDEPGLRVRPGRDASVRRRTSRRSGPTSRSSTSNGRSSARPTTRRSSTRRCRRSRTRCSRACGAATSSPSPSRPSRCAISNRSASTFSAPAKPGAIETAKAAGDDYPLGITANSYDAFNWDDGPQAHKDYIARLKSLHKEEPPSSWPITGYIGMQILTAAIAKAGVDRQRQGARRR